MAVIENFDAISVQEQMKFAEALLKTINSERIFSDQTNFELRGVEAAAFTGGLYIEVKQTNPIEVERRATWTAANEDDAESAAYDLDADYDNSLDEDALKAFKTSLAVIDGYNVELQIDDVDEEIKPVEVEVEDISHEDDGIGHNEFWGVSSFDSRPYVAVKGTLVHSCNCYVSFYVEPVDTFEEPVEGPTETSADKPDLEVE